MNIIEKHPFPPFIPNNISKLVIGSFPGREQTQFDKSSNEWYYGAKRNQFWKILSKVYDEELVTKSDKIDFCNKNGIGITDIFLKVIRKNQSNLDSDLKIEESNFEFIINTLKKNQNIFVFFTSKFVQDRFLEVIPYFTNYVCLLSPSPSANITISKSLDFQKFKTINPSSNTIDFRIDMYKKHFLK